MLKTPENRMEVTVIPFPARRTDMPVARSQRLCKQETGRVRAALSQDRLLLFYQPVVRADSPEFVAFHEALVRIKMPDDTIVVANRFMPFVENSALGRILDRKTLEMALIALHGNPALRLSVNVSPYSMGDQGWLDIFCACSRDVGDRLILEITEREAMTDVRRTAAFLAHVRKFGASVALDDFGAGYTSFRYFRDFHFDIVKIDGLFIRDIPHSRDNQVLVEALLNISAHFDMMTVAEFVETPAEAAFVSKMGVDCLQGYLIGKPAATPQAGDPKIAVRHAGNRQSG